MGDESLEHARAVGKVKLHGPSELTRGMQRWFGRSKFADDNPLPSAIRIAS
jgi:cell division protein FtsX